MKIAFVSFFNLSQPMAATARLSRMVSFLQERGVSVRVICPQEDRFGTGGAGLFKKIKRFSGFIRTYVEMIRAALQEPADFYYVSSPPISMLFPAFALSFLRPGKILFEERDLLTLNPLITYKMIRSNPLSRFVEKIVLKRSRFVVAVVSTISDELVARWPSILHEERIITVPNGFYKKDYAFEKTPGIATQAPSQKLRLLHSGSFYQGRNPYPLLRAMARMKQRPEEIAEKLEVVFLGTFESPEYERKFMEEAAALKLGAVFRCIKPKPRAEALRELQNSDALFLITHESGSEWGVPAKLFEYIAVGKPILAISHDPFVVGPIEKHHLGWCIPHEETGRTAAVLDEWLENPSRLKNMKLPGLELAEYDAEKHMERLYEKIKRTAEGTA